MRVIQARVLINYTWRMYIIKHRAVCEQARITHVVRLSEVVRYTAYTIPKRINAVRNTVCSYARLLYVTASRNVTMHLQYTTLNFLLYGLC
jgi:hypothetical protein